MTEGRLLQILHKGPINFWELIKNEYYIKDFVGIIKTLQNNNTIGIKNSIISLQGRSTKNTVEDQSNSTNKRIEDISVPNFDISEYGKLRKKFPLSDTFDQQLLTDEAISIKLQILFEQDDLRNKDIVCIGDDDMFAIALALTKLPKSITVLDIDERIVSYENGILNNLGYKDSCLITDLLKPLSPDLIGRFDVFECEPPDNPKGHRLFISRGIQLLKNDGGVGYSGICDQTLSKNQRTEIVTDIKKMSGTIVDVWEHCKLYETVGDEYNWVLNLPKGVDLPTQPWFNSNLMRLRFGKDKSPIIIQEADLSYVTELSTILL